MKYGVLGISSISVAYLFLPENQMKGEVGFVR